MGRCKILGLLKPFLSYMSQLSGISIQFLWFLTSLPPNPESLISHACGGGGWWQHLLDQRDCVLFWECSFKFGGPQITDGCYILLYWYGRRYSTSQSLHMVINSTIYERHFIIFFPMVLRSSSQVRWKFSLICHSRCQFQDQDHW